MSIDWKGYFTSKAKHLFRWGNFVNINLGYFICFFIAVMSSIDKFWYGIPVGFIGIILVSIYADANSGHWKGEDRKEIKKEAIEQYVQKLEEENKKLKEQLNGGNKNGVCQT